ncbi:MAG: UvrD-helicase domain-containing protein [Fimbriimonadaceae bacterium]
MGFDFTEEQLHVIRSRGAMLPVVATAGSGKTRCLTERYVRAVLDDAILPSEILAISFTRASAAEMKLRIAGRFLELGRSDFAAEVDASPIQTFHSFAESLLRANSIDLGLSPGFEILDEGLKKSWLRQSVSEVLADIYRNESSSLERVRGWAHFVPSGQRNEFVETHLQKLVDLLFGGDRGIDWYEKNYSSTETVLRQWLAAVGESPLAEDSSSTELRFAAEERFPSMDDEAWKRWIEEAEVISFLVRAACEVQRRLQSMMTEQQKLDFGFLEQLAVEATVDNESVREFIRDRFKMLMVDEAQDINVRQHRWVRAMPISDKLLVGDPNQSIYRFRHAKPELFRELIRSEEPLTISTNFRSTERIIRLVNDLFSTTTGSFGTMRSSDSTASEGSIEAWIADGTDATFKLVEHFKRANDSGIGYGSMAIICDRWDEGQAFYKVLNAANVPARILEQSETVHRRLEIRDVANALETFLYPHRKPPLIALLRSPYVGLSMDSILLLAQQQDLWASLSDFDWPMQEDAKKAADFLVWHERCRDVIPRLPAWEAISVLFHESNWLETAARLPARDTVLPNLQQLQALACANQDWDLDTFISLSEELKLERRIHTVAATHDDLKSSIQILTVHHAKGLEFDLVFVPYGKRSTSIYLGEWVLEETTGILAYVPSKNHLAPVSAIVKAIEAEEKSEALRKEYVRLTRARKVLAFEARSADVKRQGRVLSSILKPKGIGVNFADPSHLVVRWSELS